MLLQSLPRSLSAKLILAGGGAVTAILIAATALTAWQARARVEVSILAQADSEARAISQEIASKLADAGSAADAMTGTIAAAYDAGMHDRSLAVAMLKPATERYPNIFGSWLAERPGAFDGSSDPKGLGANAKGIFAPYWTKNGSNVTLSSFEVDYEAAWYKAASTSRKGAVTEPYLSKEGNLLTSIAYPMLSNGKEIGVAGIDLRLETLSGLLGAMRPFGDGRVMLVSSSGAWLANPDNKLLTKHYADEGSTDLSAALADGKPRILRGIANGSTARVILPFVVPGLNATWATIMDVPEANFSALVNREVWVAASVGLCMLMALLGALAVATRMILRKPMASLVRSVDRLGRSDYETPVDDQGRQDEVGALARALEGFRHALAHGAQSERMVAVERQKADFTRDEVAVHQAAQGAAQAQVVEHLAAGLSRLSSGDLSVRLHEPFAQHYEPLRIDFNAAADALGDVLRGVIDTAAAIRSGSGEIATAADDLSRRTEQQAASLEETAAALDEITATVRKTAEGARHAHEAVGTTKSDTERSSEVVGRAIQAMDGIERSAREISQIIGVIDEIAFQTNLLALNAGVEAARAGEAGRGFAVVASEVRALAQRSADAAKEIKSLLSASSAQVGQGVALVSETGQALQRIAARVVDINGVVAAIAASAQEQASGLDQVNTAINQMDQVTQQNAAMVEESTAATQNLSRETEELSRLVKRFQLKDGQGTEGSTVIPMKPASSRTRATGIMTAAVPRIRGGAAPKIQDAPVANGWEVF